ncbi:transposase (plasmid) [Antarctobacter heliothermus]|uniref:Transposase n=1 Tax=Antarctobacter heliothermus TaxID=74033 RepID=A0A222EBF5_9RHOB|nr:transposase [Antarctobacter heliothermus]
MNIKSHANCDSEGRPINLLVTADPVSDYIGGRGLLDGMLAVKWLLGGNPPVFNGTLS